MTELVRDGRVATLGFRAAGSARRALRRLAAIRPLYVVSAFVVAEWLATLALALTVRHRGWLFYHGGDQIWFYTTSWLLAHGRLVPTAVGYGWSILELPFALVSGPNLLQALPAIVLLDVLMLMPVAMVAIYGIGVRLAGRNFGYLLLTLWLTLPFLGILYTNQGFHQRYTELALPDSFGLTSLADFPSMVMLAVSAYFCLRVLQRLDWLDGVLAGLFAGFAIGVKPSSSLFLAGVVLAFAAARKVREAAAFALGLAPFLLALVVWKWRGLGYLPLFHAEQAVRLALGGAGVPLAAVNWQKYVNLDWHQLGQVFDSFRDHFWSARVVEWAVVAGAIGLARRWGAAALLFAGWFGAFLIVKGTQSLASLESGAFLHGLVQTIPAFVVLVSGVVFLVPRLAARTKPVPAARRWGHPPVRIAAVAALFLAFAVVPLALAATAQPVAAGTQWLSADYNGPIPVARMGVVARVVAGRVRLSWDAQPAAGAPVFYGITRGPLSGAEACPPSNVLTCPVVHLTHGTAAVDAPAPGRYDYRILVGGSWIEDIAYGDFYVASEPVTVTVP